MTKEVLSAIQDAVGTQVFGIWFLIGAALVFFMQAGFAMVETGFTRAKNARKYYYEESDGFLYWNLCIYPAWIWNFTW